MQTYVSFNVAASSVVLVPHTQYTLFLSLPLLDGSLL